MTYLITKEILFVLVQSVYKSSIKCVMNVHAPMYASDFTCVFGMQKIDCCQYVVEELCAQQVIVFSTCIFAKACCASCSTFGLYSSLSLVVRVCLEFCSVY